MFYDGCDYGGTVVHRGKPVHTQVIIPSTARPFKVRKGFTPPTQGKAARSGLQVANWYKLRCLRLPMATIP
jgi:hypothetical protein